jgi:hypothetical protein
LQQEELLLEVGPAERLPGSEHELVALLQRPEAASAEEAVEVEDHVPGAHHVLPGAHALSARPALDGEDAVHNGITNRNNFKDNEKFSPIFRKTLIEA